MKTWAAFVLIGIPSILLGATSAAADNPPAGVVCPPSPDCLACSPLPLPEGCAATGLVAAAAARPAPQPLVRPRTGSQLYAQRVAAVAAGQIYSQTPTNAFADQWLGSQQQPSHEQWQGLLRQEADLMASRQDQAALAVVLGDSLCLWLPPDQLPPEHIWLNQSISGETTAHIRQRLAYFAALQPQVIYLMAGINDLKNQVPPEDVVANLAAIVQQLQAQHGAAQVVVFSILPTRWPTIPEDRIRRVNQQVESLVQQQGATFIDLQAAFADSQGTLRPELTSDGLHLNAQGYDLLTTYLSGPWVRAMGF